MSALAWFATGGLSTVLTSFGFVTVLELVRRLPAVSRPASPRLDVVRVSAQRSRS